MDYREEAIECVKDRVLPIHQQVYAKYDGEIRKCAREKGLETCGDCPEKDTCPKVGTIWQNNPQARENLEA